MTATKDLVYKHIVILTGAGISAESGIPVFRSETGLWENERVEDVCVPEALRRNPKKVHDFYNKLRTALKDREANAAHKAIALLQQTYAQYEGCEAFLVTQNIDDLHEKAGSTQVVHMHGALKSLWCTKCGARFSFDGLSSPDDHCPKCAQSGGVRPDIVFFEEMPYHMELIERKLAQCDLFISIGTSGVVYPAAGFCSFAKSCGAKCVEFNLEKSAVATAFDYGIYAKASQSVPQFVEHLLKTGSLLEEQA